MLWICMKNTKYKRLIKIWIALKIKLTGTRSDLDKSQRHFKRQYAREKFYKITNYSLKLHNPAK